MAENKKRFHFNLFDALIIVLALAVGLGAVYLRNRSSGEPSGRTRETATMRFIVELTAAPIGMLDQMTPGCSVYRSTDGTYLGTLAEVSYKPHTEIKWSETAGAFEEIEYQENYDIYVTIENQGYSTSRDIVIGSVALKVGDEIAVKDKGFAKMGYVYSVDTMGAEITQDSYEGNGSLNFTYVMNFTDCRDFVAANFHEGDRLYDKLSGSLLGIVQSVRTEPHFETQVGEGGAVFAEKTGRSDVYVTVKGRAVDKADGYYLDGGIELKVGATSQLVSQYINRNGLFFEILSMEQ